MAGKATNRPLPFNKEAVAKFVRDVLAAHERIKAGKQDGRITQEERTIDGVRGLSVVVKPSGVATYLVRYQIGKGKGRKKRCQAIGRWGPGGVSLHDARTKALAAMTEVSKGGDPIATERERANAKAELTLRELFAERVEKDTRRAERTLADYGLALEADVFPDLGDLPANDVDADQIVTVLERIEARSKHAAHKARSALGSTYRWGLQRRRVKRNPVSGLGFNHVSAARKVLLSDEEMAKLWKAIDSPRFGATEPMRIILKLAVITGQRNSEVAGAERSELRLDGPTPRWTTPARRMKRKTDDQIIPLSTQAAALFARAVELAGESPFVFPGSTQGRRQDRAWRAEHIGQESVSRAMARARELAGIDDIRVHDLRKCLTTWLAERFERPDVLDRILHHARKGVTGTHYNFSVLEGAVRAALQTWANHVSQITGQGGVAGNVVALKRA